MKKVIIKENEKGLLFVNGKFKKLLEAGKYYTYGENKLEQQTKAYWDSIKEK